MMKRETVKTIALTLGIILVRLSIFAIVGSPFWILAYYADEISFLVNSGR